MEQWDRQWEELKTEAFLLSSMSSNQALVTDTPLHEKMSNGAYPDSRNAKLKKKRNVKGQMWLM